MWNKIAALMVLVTAASLLLTPFEVEARGGRGGGRGGGGRGGGGRSVGGARGGGAYRGGRTMNRTPTMSRASSRPAASQARRAQTRPAVSQGRVGQSRQALQQRPSAANRADLRNQVNRYAQTRPAQDFNGQAFSQRAQNFSNQRGNQIANNRQISDQVSQNLRQSRPNSDRWFDGNFLDRHDVGRDYLGTGANLWRPAAWSTLAGWGAWNWSNPYYYDEGGYAYPVTASESAPAYSSSSITEPYQPVQMYSAQGTPAPTAGDWLPLGVFAVAHNANAAAQSNRFIQLALNRSGEIAGVLYNSLTDAAQDLTGRIDSNTQKAYWSLTSGTGSPIASTGLYNLTEDQTPVNVHFLDGTDQTWALVRLQQEQ